MVEDQVLVFMVFSQDSVQQRRLPENAFLSGIVEQIVDPVSCGSLPGSSSSHSPAGVEERADELAKGFSHFSPN